MYTYTSYNDNNNHNTHMTDNVTFNKVGFPALLQIIRRLRQEEVGERADEVRISLSLSLYIYIYMSYIYIYI